MGWTAGRLPSFAGRTVVVTGANSGLGEVTARELARVGARTILAVRNTAKGEAAADTMFGNVEVRELDLANLKSVRAFADGLDGEIDILINNAGIMAVPYGLTADAFESQFGTNHLGHFALTGLLLPRITDRVVTVSSFAHYIGRVKLDDLNWRARPYSAWGAYGQSKLANLMFTSELQRRLEHAGARVRSVAAHPGYSATELQSHTGPTLSGRLMVIGNKLATTADFGARQTLYAASQDVPGNTFVGPRFGYVGPSGPTGRSPLARNRTTARGLWELSEQLTGVPFGL